MLDHFILNKISLFIFGIRWSRIFLLCTIFILGLCILFMGSRSLRMRVNMVLFFFGFVALVFIRFCRILDRFLLLRVRGINFGFSFCRPAYSETTLSTVPILGHIVQHNSVSWKVELNRIFTYSSSNNELVFYSLQCPRVIFS